MKKLSSQTRSTRGPENFLRELDESRALKTIPPRITAEFSAKALVQNYHAIQELVPDQQILPMIKANAYGHGAEWAARLLTGLPGLYALGVATLEEGVQIRSAIGAKNRSTR